MALQDSPILGMPVRIANYGIKHQVPRQSTLGLYNIILCFECPVQSKPDVFQSMVGQMKIPLSNIIRLDKVPIQDLVAMQQLSCFRGK